nr:HD domain-containing protein [Candidatus Njordarchaeota archaeon]
MSTPLIVVDPITFKVSKIDDPKSWENYTYKFLKKVTDEASELVKGDSDNIKRLKIINNKMVELLSKPPEECEWASVPSDSRFPGFFSSLADHALATSTIGVAIAVECLNKKVDLSSEYVGKELFDLLKSRAGAIEVVRLLCLLHDSGKPFYDHVEQTRKAVEDFLSKLGFGGLASEMGEAASKHHYGVGAEQRPETRLEWVVAYADKVAVQDRIFTGKILTAKEFGKAIQPLRWLRSRVDAREIVKAQQLAEALEKTKDDTEVSSDSSDWRGLKDILPLDYKHTVELDQQLQGVANNLGVEIKLALIPLEGAGIQGFVSKSSAARHLVGRSSLVEVATIAARKEIEEALAPESVIYATSGSVLALVSSSELPVIVARANEKFRDFTKKGMALKGCKEAENVSFSLFELKNGPGFAWKGKATLSVVGKRNFGELYTILNNTIEVLTEGAQSSVVKALGVNDTCSICFEEEALSEEDPEVVEVRRSLPEDEREGFSPGVICLNVERHRMNLRDNLQKLLVIGFDKKVTVALPEIGRTVSSETAEKIESSPKYRLMRSVRESLEKILNEECNRSLVARLSEKLIMFRGVASWNELGKQSKDALQPKEKKEEIYDVAFIKGDGDNFGLVKSSMSNITLYRKVSKMFEDTIQNSIAKALAEVIVKQLKLHHREEQGVRSTPSNPQKVVAPEFLTMPFDVLYFGGDDFMLVLDAGFTFIFLDAFRKAIIERLGSRRENYEKGEGENLSILPLGISLGVVVAPNRAPVHGTLNALNELEGKAKKLSKQKQRKVDGSSIFGADICVAFQRFTTIPSKEFVNELYRERPMGDKIKFSMTAWPRLGSKIFGGQGSSKNTLTPLVKLTRMLLKGGLNANNVARAVGIELREEEAKLRIRYKAARMGKERSEREAYKQLAENLVDRELPAKLEREATSGEREPNIKFQYRDVADVMKIIYDNESLLPGGDE